MEEVTCETLAHERLVASLKHFALWHIFDGKPQRAAVMSPPSNTTVAKDEGRLTYYTSDPLHGLLNAMPLTVTFLRRDFAISPWRLRLQTPAIH